MGPLKNFWKTKSCLFIKLSRQCFMGSNRQKNIFPKSEWESFLTLKISIWSRWIEHWPQKNKWYSLMDSYTWIWSVLVDQQKLTFISSVQTMDTVYKTCQEQSTTPMTGGENSQRNWCCGHVLMIMMTYNQIHDESTSFCQIIKVKQ